MPDEDERHKKIDKKKNNNNNNNNGIQRYAAIYSDGHVIRHVYIIYSTVNGRLGYMLGILNTEKTLKNLRLYMLPGDEKFPDGQSKTIEFY